MGTEMGHETFAQELKAWRASRKYTQRDAALALDVKLRTYQEWEHGRQSPDQKGVVRKAIEFDMWKAKMAECIT